MDCRQELGLLGVAHPDCATHQGVAEEHLSARRLYRQTSDAYMNFSALFFFSSGIVSLNEQPD